MSIKEKNAVNAPAKVHETMQDIVKLTMDFRLSHPELPLENRDDYDFLMLKTIEQVRPRNDINLFLHDVAINTVKKAHERKSRTNLEKLVTVCTLQNDLLGYDEDLELSVYLFIEDEVKECHQATIFEHLDYSEKQLKGLQAEKEAFLSRIAHIDAKQEKIETRISKLKSVLAKAIEMGVNPNEIRFKKTA